MKSSLHVIDTEDSFFIRSLIIEERPTINNYLQTTEAQQPPNSFLLTNNYLLFSEPSLS